MDLEYSIITHFFDLLLADFLRSDLGSSVSIFILISGFEIAGTDISSIFLSFSNFSSLVLSNVKDLPIRKLSESLCNNGDGKSWSTLIFNSFWEASGIISLSFLTSSALFLVNAPGLQFLHPSHLHILVHSTPLW